MVTDYAVHSRVTSRESPAALAAASTANETSAAAGGCGYRRLAAAAIECFAAAPPEQSPPRWWLTTWFSRPRTLGPEMRAGVLSVIALSWVVHAPVP